MVRYPQDYRNSVQTLRNCPIVTERGEQVRLGDITTIKVTDGPPMIRSENARLSGWVYVDVRGTDLHSAVKAMQAAVAKEVKLPPGYSIGWSGQRSEEHTSELQSLMRISYAVFCLKKKNNTYNKNL